MGNVAKVSRLVVILAVTGSDCSTLFNAEFTSSSVRNMSTDQSKKRLTSAVPRLVVERTTCSPGTLLTASSIGLVMVTSICSTGITPLSTPMTTRGKSVAGKTAIGVWERANQPEFAGSIGPFGDERRFWRRRGGHLLLAPGFVFLTANGHLGAVVEAIAALGNHIVLLRDALKNLYLLSRAQADPDWPLVSY